MDSWNLLQELHATQPQPESPKNSAMRETPQNRTLLPVYFLNMHLLSSDHLTRVGLPAALVPNPAANGVKVGRAWDLARQLLERLPLRLGDQQRGEDTAEHEQRKDFHDVVEPWRRIGRGRVTPNTEGPEDNLGDDGADLTGGGGETVGGGAVARGETFTGYDERGCVGA